MRLFLKILCDNTFLGNDAIPYNGSNLIAFIERVASYITEKESNTNTLLCNFIVCLVKNVNIYNSIKIAASDHDLKFPLTIETILSLASITSKGKTVNLSKVFADALIKHIKTIQSAKPTVQPMQSFPPRKEERPTEEEVSKRTYDLIVCYAEPSLLEAPSIQKYPLIQSLFDELLSSWLAMGNQNVNLPNNIYLKEILSLAGDTQIGVVARQALFKSMATYLRKITPHPSVETTRENENNTTNSFSYFIFTIYQLLQDKIHNNPNITDFLKPNILDKDAPSVHFTMFELLWNVFPVKDFRLTLSKLNLPNDLDILRKLLEVIKTSTLHIGGESELQALSKENRQELGKLFTEFQINIIVTYDLDSINKALPSSTNFNKISIYSEEYKQLSFLLSQVTGNLAAAFTEANVTTLQIKSIHSLVDENNLLNKIEYSKQLKSLLEQTPSIIALDLSVHDPKGIWNYDFFIIYAYMDYNSRDLFSKMLQTTNVKALKLDNMSFNIDTPWKLFVVTLKYSKIISLSMQNCNISLGKQKEALEALSRSNKSCAFSEGGLKNLIAASIFTKWNGKVSQVTTQTGTTYQLSFMAKNKKKETQTYSHSLMPNEIGSFLESAREQFIPKGFNL